MMKTSILKMVRVALLLGTSTLLASCEPPQVYGSIGYSSFDGGYGGYGGYGGLGTSIRIGGRIL